MQTYEAHEMRRNRGSLACTVLLACLTVFSQSLWGGTTTANTVYIPQIGHGADGAGNQFSSEINLINLSTTASQVVVRTFDEDGGPVRLLLMDLGTTAPEAVSELTIQLPGLGTGDVHTLSENPDSLLLGWASVSTDQAVGVQAVFRIRDVDGNLTTAANIRIGPLTSGASFFGLQNATVNTGIAFVNPPGNPAARVSVHAVDKDGTGLLTSMINLGPGEKDSRFLFEYLPSLGSFNGSIEIRSVNMADPESMDIPQIAILPIRQEGVVLTTSDLFPLREE